MTGIELIAAERERQINDEGWSAEHDDRHTDGAMAYAAACYAAGESIFVERRFSINGSPDLPHVHFENAWPWEARWHKRTAGDRIRDLVKAGALIAAEIDRLQRLQQPKVAPDGI